LAQSFTASSLANDFERMATEPASIAWIELDGRGGSPNRFLVAVSTRERGEWIPRGSKFRVFGNETGRLRAQSHTEASHLLAGGPVMNNLTHFLALRHQTICTRLCARAVCVLCGE
jgi:hypothetical protein